MNEHKSPETWSDEEKWKYLVRHERLGELLVRRGKLSLVQLEEALKEQESSQSTKHLGEIIVARKFLTLDEIVDTLDNQKLTHQTSENSIQELKSKSKE
jgi:hypothetical protein